MNNAVFGKTIENGRKHRNIKLVTAERRRYYLVLEPNYHTTKFFTENLSAIEMRKTEILMNIPGYLGLRILVWFWKTKIWWKYKTLLHGYRQPLCSCKNRWYLKRYCRKC